mgnify:CR=1 FL=1
MAQPDADTLRALFEREPADAVAYLERKGLRVTWNWAEMLDEAHARAFTVAKATRLDVLRDIRKGVLDSVREGKTLRQFRAELTPLLQEKGWWGKQLDVDGSEIQLGSPRRLKTIYQTNVQSAYMAGRAQAAAEADAFPYLQYVAVMDSRTRPTHAALDGQVFAKDDPIWDTHMPPNGFNCRCRVRPLTRAQAEREGLDVRSSEGQTVTRTVDAGADQASGELFPTTQHGIRVTRPDGKATVMWADPGFNASPAAGHWMDTLLAKKAVDALGDEAGFASVARAVTSPPRMRAWSAFVANTVDSGLEVSERGTGRRITPDQNQTMTVGLAPLPVVRALAKDGKPLAPVLHVSDRLLVGKKARRHADDGDALTREEWLALPDELRDSAQWEWMHDERRDNLVAYRVADDLALTFDANGQARSAYHDRAAAGKIKRGEWKRIEVDAAGPDSNRDI